MPSATSLTARFQEAAGADRRSRMMVKLMEAAVGLFSEFGVDATSVLEITNKAGVANGTFYNYFKNKEEIVFAVYKMSMESLVADIVRNLNAIPGAQDQIALGTIWFIDTVSKEPHWGRMAMNALEQPGEFRENTKDIIGGYVNHGVAQGCFQAESTSVFLDLFIAVLVGALRSRLEGDDTDGRAIGLLAAELHLRMLGVPPGPAHRIPAHALIEYGEHPEGAPPVIDPGYRHRKPPARRRPRAAKTPKAAPFPARSTTA